MEGSLRLLPIQILVVRSLHGALKVPQDVKKSTTSSHIFPMYHVFAKFSALSALGVALRERCTPLWRFPKIGVPPVIIQSYRILVYPKLWKPSFLARKTTLLQMLRDGRLSVNAPTLYPSNEVPVTWARRRHVAKRAVSKTLFDN